MASLIEAHWLIPTVFATSCWALSDVCCDCAIAGGGDDEGDAAPPQPEKKPARGDAGPDAAAGPVASKSSSSPSKGDRPERWGAQLTPEQNAVVSALVSLCACGASLRLGFGSLGDVSKTTDGAVAVFAGAVHFVAYAVELRAYRTASSTVITPLLQLSAVWMTLLRAAQPLLLSTLFFDVSAAEEEEVALDGASLYVASSAMHPAHLLAIFCIFVGGFLPAARGRVSRFCEAKFYAEDAVRFCIVGELLICVYNALLHACTFEAGAAAADRGDVLRFFALSRLGNALACSCIVLCGLSDGFRWDDVRALRRADRRYLGVAAAGELLSVTGVCVVMFSYANFHEPAVVNAAEGGVQQLLNLVFAIALRAFAGFGREVDDRRTKLVSFALVSTGLYLSTIEAAPLPPPTHR